MGATNPNLWYLSAAAFVIRRPVRGAAVLPFMPVRRASLRRDPRTAAPPEVGPSLDGRAARAARAGGPSVICGGPRRPAKSTLRVAHSPGAQPDAAPSPGRPAHRERHQPDARRERLTRAWLRFTKV